MKIEVSGRICLFGEHSDWAATYREINENICKGYALVAGINQKIMADVSVDDNFIISFSKVNDLVDYENLKINADLKDLYKLAKSDSFYSYASAAAYIIKKNYDVKGLKINILDNTLPIKKGLASSAAISVLVIKAYNALYKLELSGDQIMKYAFESELLTGSKCGRLDQFCYLGNSINKVVFDGNKISYENIFIKKDINMIIIDLNGKKDTKKILNDLNSCYPFPHEQIETKMVNYFGIINKKIVKQAEKCIKNGYIKELGKLMTYSQKLFDKYVIPICPSELTAPLLHNILNDPFIKKHSYGGKGVGSQGDGTAQIIAKSKNSQTAIINYLKKMGYNSYIFDLEKTNKIKKAVIPVAGYGTRLYPYTKLINKEFCPVVYENKLKPQISVLLEELYDSNIDKICLIISSNKQKNLYKDYLLKHSSYLNTFSNYEDNVNYEEKLRKIWKKIKFIKNRHVNYGFAYSISLAKKFVGSDNFILCLGDTIYSSNNSSNCCKQLIDFYNKTKTLCVGVKKINLEEVKNYGTIKISNINDNNISIEKLYEKPDYEFARKKLLINDECYAFFGNYILDCKIFKILKKNLKYNKSSCIFTNCLDEMRDANNLLGYLIDGNSYDFGNVESYINNFGNIKSIGDE